jgi:hypothetical protein
MVRARKLGKLVLVSVRVRGCKCTRAMHVWMYDLDVHAHKGIAWQVIAYDGFG